MSEAKISIRRLKTLRNEEPVTAGRWGMTHIKSRTRICFVHSIRYAIRLWTRTHPYSLARNVLCPLWRVSFFAILAVKVST